MLSETGKYLIYLQRKLEQLGILLLAGLSSLSGTSLARVLCTFLWLGLFWFLLCHNALLEKSCFSERVTRNGQIMHKNVIIF